MQAARFEGVGTPLAIRDTPVPQPGPLEVLVRVDACGICLSDVHLLDGSIPPVTVPVTPGHESCGTIAAVGSEVEGWSPGDRAVIAGGRPCRSCQRCRSGRFEECLAFELMGFAYDGAWAEYVAVPFYALSALPDGVPAEQAAILADAVATPYSALNETGALRAGESVGLWGIGGLGTHAVQLARLLGAGFVVAVDPRASARERARALGADAVLDPTACDVVAEIRALTGTGLDLAVDLVGSATVMQQAVASLGRGGRAVHVGITMEPLSLGPGLVLALQSQSVRGHLGYRKRDLDDLVRLLATGRLDLSASISDVIPLDDVADGVRRLAENEGDPVRIVVRP